LDFPLQNTLTILGQWEHRLTDAFQQGVLDNGTEIAIKKLHQIIGLDDVQFKKEFNNLMKVHHKNIIRLIAYCFEIRHTHVKDDKGEYVFSRIEHRALCFEYFKRGSLDKHLSGKTSMLLNLF